MTRESHPNLDGSKFLLKRWNKHTIYAKSGPYSHTDNINNNLYVTNSIYLYDYVVVNKNWFYSMVYTASIADTTPSYGPANGTQNGNSVWTHNANTFKNSPNAITNNYLLTYNIPSIGTPFYGNPTVFKNGDTYFEIVKGYPRNHFIHKQNLFSLYNTTTYEMVNNIITNGIYKKNSQTIDSTIGIDGLEDGSLPFQLTTVGNLNLVQTDNVINH